MVKALAAAIVLCLGFAFPVIAGAPAQGKTATQTKPIKPEWVELTPAQQVVLAPLQNEWRDLDSSRRKKWVKVADSYPKMKPQEQQRLTARMQEWAKLTPDQRRVAREKYQTIKKLPPAKRQQVTAQWQQYQQSLAPKPEAEGGEPSQTH
jgi:hypothetical protein